MDSLQATCLALLFSTQSHPVGFSALHVEQDASLASALNDKEQQLLALHEKLQRVSLQRRILEAELAPAIVDDETPQQTEALEEELVKARANRQLKETVVEATLVADPILKAVYPHTEMAAKQRSLIPLIHRRDMLSQTHANLSHLLMLKLEALTLTERSYLDMQERNKVLASRLLTLTKKRDEELKKQQDPKYKEEEKKLQRTKKNWEIVRNVAQATVVSSGVDWSRDDELRQLVLACGDD
ncbi:hypothetical protein K440DRAFT_646417 [Wilcoxina mikolae CBS 423.85]|nr:hypothetical protein K440DRAFT_646417 [Wilcoxina mikolae CBS 423.85]